jgi:archaellum component FlaC
MKKMNKKRASQSARIQELEQHIVKIYMILEQVVEKLKDDKGTAKT